MNATMYEPLPFNQMPPFLCAMNLRMILSHQEISTLLCPYAVCFSVIKSCTYWDFSSLQALHEHAYLFLIYEKCNVDRVGVIKQSQATLRVFCLWLWLTSVLAATEEGEGCERLTIFLQYRVPLGPGKFHVVVLVTKDMRKKNFHRSCLKCINLSWFVTTLSSAKTKHLREF